jgi:hypothetical protein
MAHRHASALAGVAKRSSQSLLPFFEYLRLPKANAFPPSVTLDEINPSIFERSTDGRIICESHWALPINHLGSTDRGHANL